MIRKVDDKWVLYSQDGSKTLGTHDTREDAVKQEQAIEASKHRAAECDDLRTFHLRTAGMPVRTDTHDGRPHLVIPVIALRQGVIHAVNAETPEYVSAEALARAAETWNGKHLVVGHPVREGKQCSATESGVWDERGFGVIKASRVKGRNLSMEAWVDPARLEALGQSALLSDLKAGKQVEVSVGAHVRTLNKAGNYEGRKYDAEWGEIAGDHLAFLPGGRGACSIAMGCGAHRAASVNLSEEKTVSLREKVKAFIADTTARAAAMFDTPSQQASEEEAELIAYSTMRDLMDGVQDSVKSASGIIDELIVAEEDEPTHTPADEEAETEIEAAQMESIAALCNSAANALMSISTCCYKALQPDVNATPTRYMEQRALVGKVISKATMKSIQGMHDAAHAAHDHAVGLGADCAGDMKMAAAKMQDCPTCDGSGNVGKNPCPTCDGAGEVKMKAAEEHVNQDGGNPSADSREETTMTKDERNATIKALAACECSGFKGDAAALETLTDARIEALQTASKAREDALAETATLKAASAAKPEPKPLTVEEFMAVAPAELKTLIESKKAEDAAMHAHLVGALKTAAASAYTEDELKALDLGQLRKLATLAKVNEPTQDVSFAGRGVPNRAAGESDPFLNPPNPWSPEALKAAQSRRVQ